MQKSAVTSQPKSIKTAILFSIVVLFIIICALVVRFVSLLHQSVYDGLHRFTVVLKLSDTDSTVVSTEKLSDTVAVIHLTSKKSFWPIDGKLGIPIDGIIFTKSPQSLSNTFLRAVIPTNLTTNHMSSYDVFRLAMLLRTTPAGKIKTEDLTVTGESLPENIRTELADSAITQENKSIQIINGTDTSGVGSRLDKIITTLGGNVISIETAPDATSSSAISYVGDKTYTVVRLERLMQLHAVKRKEGGLSDILLVIGKDRLSLPMFQ